MEGFLLVDKPAGISSFRVVAIVRRLLSQEVGHRVKVGHTGTLDPAATGLLILVVGSYTKRAAEFSKLNKSYLAELTLGQVSTTDDIEGELTVVNSREPAPEEVQAVLAQFKGQLSQIPPAYSAVKIGGQRAYKLARAGRPVEIKPRTVTVNSIKDIHYEYPKLSFEADVSSGTYIRSLAREIGEKLGVGAYLSGLKRLSVGEFYLTDAIKPEQEGASQLLKIAKTP